MPYKKHSRWHYRSRKSKKKKKKKFRSKLSETTRRKWRHKSEEKKIILKSFTKQEKRLADSLMIMRQLYLRLNKK